MNYEKERKAIIERQAAELAAFEANYNKAEPKQVDKEMLKALKNMVNMAEGIYGFDPSAGEYGCREMRQAQYVIAKATEGNS